MLERKLTFAAPIETVYQVIRDFESYPEFLSTTHSAREKQSKKGVEVDFSIEVLKEIKYTLAFELKEPTEIRWSFVKGDLMKRNNGAWILKSKGPKETEATYQIDIDFGWLVPKMIIDQVTKIQLPEMLAAFQKRVDKQVAEAS